LLLCPDVCQNTSAASGDFNGDGRSDVVFIGSGMGLYMGGPAPTPIWFQQEPRRILDMDGDGYSDLVAFNNSAESDYRGGPDGVSPSSGQPIPSQAAVPMQADFDGDGSWDAVDVAGATVWYGYDASTQTFGRSAPLPALPPSPRVVDEAALDMNADGYDDLIVSVEGGGLLYLAGSPAGLASAPVMLPAP
jgi:hypothetical protein